MSPEPAEHRCSHDQPPCSLLHNIRQQLCRHMQDLSHLSIDTATACLLSPKSTRVRLALTRHPSTIVWVCARPEPAEPRCDAALHAALRSVVQPYMLPWDVQCSPTCCPGTKWCSPTCCPGRICAALDAALGCAQAAGMAQWPAVILTCLLWLLRGMADCYCVWGSADSLT